MSGIIICAKRTQLLPGPADNLLKMTMPNLPRTFAILLLPTLLAGCKLDDIPGLGPDPRTVAKEAEAKAIGLKAREVVRETFSVEHMARQMIDLLDGLVSNPSPTLEA